MTENGHFAGPVARYCLYIFALFNLVSSYTYLRLQSEQFGLFSRKSLIELKITLFSVRPLLMAYHSILIRSRGKICQCLLSEQCSILVWVEILSGDRVMAEKPSVNHFAHLVYVSPRWTSEVKLSMDAQRRRRTFVSLLRV
jgi:hypothetical protein